MKIGLTTSSKLMGAGIALSLAWFLLESCDCDQSKEDEFPGFWVACIDNKPTLMTYNGDTPVVVSSDPAGNFNPSQYNCSTPGSPPRPNSQTPAFPVGTPSGPGGSAVVRPRAASAGSSYLPQQLRALPFIPDIPRQSTPPACDSTYPDVFQTVHTQALVTRVSTCPFQIKATIPVVSRPLQVQITPDGSTAIVTSFDNAVNFISVATNQVINTLHTDASINPQAIAISADGTRAYVTSFNISNPVVLVIDITSTTAPKILATIPTIQYPSGAFLTPDNSQLWITSAIASSVDIIDTLTNTDVTGLALGLTTEVAFNSTGTRAYITSATSTPGTVAVVDTATYQILTTYTVGAGPTDIAMSYGDQFLVVNNNNDGSVSVIDLLKNTVLTTKVGPSPSGISFVH
jgi:DNA-binding beta-propeller fold protein YncE